MSIQVSKNYALSLAKIFFVHVSLTPLSYAMVKIILAWIDGYLDGRNKRNDEIGALSLLKP